MSGRLDFGLSRRRVPMVLQTEAAECGLACLAMVAAAHGLRTDLPTLRQRFPVSLKGTTLADIMHMADGLGLQAGPCAPNSTRSCSCRRPASCTGT
jgi:ATP-binding cassette subfamily B protein RaxB